MQTYQNHQSPKYQNCSFPKVFCKDVNDQTMQRYVNNSSHSSFVYIYRNHPLADIEIILNALHLLQDEVQTYHHHRSSENRNCSSAEGLCKDVNDHSMQRYVNNSCHPSFVYIIHNLFLLGIETVLGVLSLLHKEV